MHTYTFNNRPWCDPEECDAIGGILPGADTGFAYDKDTALVFHTTTCKNADSNHENGPLPSKELEVGGHPEFGVPGRQMPAGFWVSSRPTLPTDQDNWMPNVCMEPWEILGITVPFSVLTLRYVYEHTWYVPQFCLQISDIKSIGRLSPERMPTLLHPETLKLFCEYRADYHLPSPYQDAIEAAAAVMEVVN
jgi:hypothetical protein